MNTPKKKIIWFIDGPVPTPADYEALDKLASHRVLVVFRNAQQVAPGDSPERCDAVGGCVPSAYEHLPVASEDLTKPAETETETTQAAPLKPAPSFPGKTIKK